MTVWTREQISQVRGLRGEAEVSLGQPRLGSAKQAARQELAKALTRMAEPFAVDLDVRDFQFAELDPDDARYTIKICCWWEPQTREVEFHGGPSDGTVLEVEKPGQTIMLAEFPPIDWTAAEIAPTEPLTPLGASYDLTGWSETNRRWVYSRR